MTVVALNNGKEPKRVDAFDFGFELSKALLLPHIERRPRNGLTSSILRKIETVTGVPEKEKVHEPLLVNHPPLSEKEAFCTICHEETKGKKQKVKKARLYNLKSQCQKCGKILCRYHLRHYCVESLCKSSVDQVE